MANIYLHYVLDLWVQQWRARHARGEVIIVRYCDDFIVGFQHRSDAEQFRCELRDRLAKFKLELHPDKTRLIAFGRYALSDRRARHLRGAPETFNFLGLSHRCGCMRSEPEKFLVLRHTVKKRMTVKLHEVSIEMRRRRHWPIAEQGRWLASVVRGHFAYYGVPTNVHALEAFRTGIAKNWYRSLRRRGQRGRINWERMTRVVARWLPPVRITHPWPQQRFDVRTRGKSPVR
jgi:hypothetical protein